MGIKKLLKIKLQCGHCPVRRTHGGRTAVVIHFTKLKLRVNQELSECLTLVPIPQQFLLGKTASTSLLCSQRHFCWRRAKTWKRSLLADFQQLSGFAEHCWSCMATHTSVSHGVSFPTLRLRRCGTTAPVCWRRAERKWVAGVTYVR